MVQATQQRTLTPFASNLTVGDGDAGFTTSALVAAIIQANTATAGFTLIWQRTVRAQTIVQFGSGKLSDPYGSTGFMHFFALDVGTDFEEGALRLVIANAQQTENKTLIEVNTQRLHTVTPTTAITATPTNINDMVPLSEQWAKAAGEDSLLQLFFSTRIAGTTVDACQFAIPVTTYS
jgi:hypothetical protein